MSERFLREQATIDGKQYPYVDADCKRIIIFIIVCRLKEENFWVQKVRIFPTMITSTW